MRVYAVLGIAVGVTSLILGVLFSLYIQITPANLASDLIFLAAGFLLIRKGWSERNSSPKTKTESQEIEKDRKVNSKLKNKDKYRKRRR